jgi:hypothetical protein
VVLQATRPTNNGVNSWTDQINEMKISRIEARSIFMLQHRNGSKNIIVRKLGLLSVRSHQHFVRSDEGNERKEALISSGCKTIRLLQIW